MARDRWPNRMLFILAAVGSAAGLGNLWRFPYLAYEHGGGAFLLPYFIALLVIGIPLLLLEFSLGRQFQKSAVGALREIKTWAGTIGWWAVGCGFMILSYYAVVMAWALLYLVNSLSLGWSSGAEGFFYNNILNISDGIGTLGAFNIPILISLFFVWLLIYFSIWKGVNSISRVISIIVPLPVILLLILLVRAVTLDGAGPGIAAYLTPSLSALMSVDVWLAAATQIFFTLTLGFGVMIAYASYTKKDQALTEDSLWTAALNSTVSILAGFVVFGTLGFLAMQSGVLVDDVAASGPGLAFVVFPEALSQMPAAALFSAVFFVMLLTLGISSAISLIEGFTAAFKERVTISSQKVALGASAVCFLLGIIYTSQAGLYYLDVIDHFVTHYGLVLVSIATMLVVGWSKKGELIRKDVARTKWFPTALWWWNIRLFVPVVLVLLLINFFIAELAEPYGGYPLWAIMIGWAAVFVPLIISWFLNRWYANKQ